MHMKKIGLVTLWENNYGSILQCYSTKTYIENKQFECALLSNTPQRGSLKLANKAKKACSLLYRSAVSRGYLHSYLDSRKSAISNLSRLSNTTRMYMNLFAEEVLKPSYYSGRELTEAAARDEYLLFFAGSDQIWHGTSEYDGFKFLRFAPKEKRFAWAPSFGTREIASYNIRQFKKSIGEFSLLSAREQDGVTLIRRLCSRDAVRLLDPVTLLSKSDWEEFAMSGMQIDSDYILLHFLNSPNRLAMEAISTLHQRYSFRFVTFGTKNEEFEGLDFVEFVDASVYDYVSLIGNASLVLTDSFHSTLFSIIMDTKF